MAPLCRCSAALQQLGIKPLSTVQQYAPWPYVHTISSIGAAWKDRIHLKGIKVYGFHGALPEENVVGQPFEVDATVFCDLKAAGTSDDLSKTINYAQVYRIINDIMTGAPKQLLESAAECICERVLRQHPRASAVQVHVRKLCIPAVPAVVQSVGVEVARTREDYPT